MSSEEIRYNGIYKKYYGRIYTYIHAKLLVSGLPVDLAEDLTQSAFQILWRRWDENRYKTDENLLKWLYNTANNKLMEVRRSEDALQHESIEDHEDDFLANEGSPDIEEQLTSDIRLQELQEILGTPQNQLLILISNGYKYQECARILKIPIGTVCSMVHRLRREMKKPKNRKKIDKIMEK
ncbi:MAG: sigma-70 family RNA polymerase sigma factor [Clostridia bacterium]|nr:sigma-70 family RNA polymerase sigma factor [Clostridia bacterium]